MVDELWKVVCRGEVDAIVATLDHNPTIIDVPMSFPSTETLMYIAAKNEWIAVIEKLVELGSAMLDAPDIYGRTPMHAAAWKGRVLSLRTLVRLGSKAIDTPDIRGVSPLHTAAIYGHASMIEAFVQMGSTAIDMSSNSGETPMHSAAFSDYPKIVKMLVRLGSRAIDTPDDRGNTPLMIAIQGRSLNTVEMLLRLGSKAIDTPNDLGHTPMHIMISYGHNYAIKILVQYRNTILYTLNNDRLSLMRTAVDSKQLQCVRTLKLLGDDCSSLVGVTIPDTLVDEVRTLVDEDEAAKLRYTVYFQRSLSLRLLFLAKR